MTIVDPTSHEAADPAFDAMRSMHDVLDEELQALQAAGLRRTLRAVQQRHAGTVLINGERIADFASNDYLGLASDPRVARAASAVLQAEGTGAGARTPDFRQSSHSRCARARARPLQGLRACVALSIGLHGEHRRHPGTGRWRRCDLLGHTQSRLVD
jgi:hypothetical protein